MSNPSRKARQDNRWSRIIQAGFVVALMASWYLATHNFGVNSLLLPQPETVYRQLADVLGTGEYAEHLQITLYELAVAFSISAIAGTSIGYALSRSAFLVRVFEPLLAGAYAVPMILFFPLYTEFFGIGEGSKIALGVTTSFFPIVLNALVGFGTVDRIYITAARSMGASNWQMLRHVLLPAALPIVVTGLRMGFIVAFLSILGGEVITSFAGIGHQINSLADSMDTGRMFAYIAIAVFISACLNMVVRYLEARAQR